MCGCVFGYGLDFAFDEMASGLLCATTSREKERKERKEEEREKRGVCMSM
jgi:hypothetical protein